MIFIMDLNGTWQANRNFWRADTIGFKHHGYDKV